ncbi:MAG: hypothetical protein AB7R40_23645 [Nitrospiraceae bacterium]
MPKLELDYTVNLGNLINAALLLSGIVLGSFAYFSDQKIESQTVRTLKERVQTLQAADAQLSAKITEAQERTTNRLSTLETQNTFILRSLNRVENAIERFKPVQ